MSNRRQQIIDAATDAGAKFVYYDRKGDEELPRGAIEEAMASGEITIEEILSAFCKGMSDAG